MQQLIGALNDLGSDLFMNTHFQAALVVLLRAAYVETGPTASVLSLLLTDV